MARPSHQTLIEQLYWLIKLRWIAVIGVILTIFFAAWGFKLSLALAPLYVIAAILGIYNLIFLFWITRIKETSPEKLVPITNRIANLQISFDLTSLAALIHFSGGVENPFIFYFVFHMVIASIFLSRRAAFLQATFAAILFYVMALAEYSGKLHHYDLKGFLTHDLYNNFLYIAGISFAFTSTLYITVYMTTAISMRLREREKRLEEANKLLTEKDRIKSEYVLRVTHDVKEHLAAIQSCIEPVTDGITGPLNERQINLLRRADERTGKLLFFVKALLAITRIKLHMGIKTESFSFSELLKTVANEMKTRAEAKKVTFVLDMDPLVGDIEGIRLYLEEAVQDILANAIKYTPSGGTISLNIKNKWDSYFITIKDTGIGIPKEDLPHIFEEFYRAKNARDVEKTGSGLGLSIAKEVVELHKGKIWVESEEGKGTIFYIELPK